MTGRAPFVLLANCWLPLARPPRNTPKLMVDNVRQNGPYIVVAPGFALAHARPDSSVLWTGMSWIRLDEPVAFGVRCDDAAEPLNRRSAP